MQTPLQWVITLRKMIIEDEKKSEEYCEELTEKINTEVGGPLVSHCFSNGERLFVVLSEMHRMYLDMDNARKIGKVVGGEVVGFSFGKKGVLRLVYKEGENLDENREVQDNEDYVNLRQQVMSDWNLLTQNSRRTWEDMARGTCKSGFELYVDAEVKRRADNYGIEQPK